MKTKRGLDKGEKTIELTQNDLKKTIITLSPEKQKGQF